MEGEWFTHHPEKGMTIYELRDRSGLTKWYGQEVFTEVCMSKECKPIRIWLFWNGLGDYLGFQLNETEQLTKMDHEPFTQDDYQQLDRILSNERSYFQHLESSDLAPDTLRLVDGYTGATLPDLSSQSVAGAVYTCFTLWQIVYGPVREIVRQLFAGRIDNAYIEQLFASNNPAYLEEALDLMAIYPSFQKQFAGKIIAVIKSSREEVALKALRDFESDLLADKSLQLQLVANLGTVSSLMRAEIIWKLSGAKAVDVVVVSELLNSFLKDETEVNELRLTYQMINHEMINDPRILHRVTDLARHENAYVRRITNALLTRLAH